MFFFAEYVNIMLLSAMMTILFLGGWHAPIDIGIKFIPPFFWFFAKTAFLFFMFAMVKAIVPRYRFAMVKAIVPRYRYDQLMRLGWKVFLPTSLVAVVIVSTVVVASNGAFGGLG